MARFTERELNIHMAFVLLREARSRRHFRAFHAELLQWAANARKRAGRGDLLGRAGV